MMSSTEPRPTGKPPSSASFGGSRVTTATGTGDAASGDVGEEGAQSMERSSASSLGHAVSTSLGHAVSASLRACPTTSGARRVSHPTRSDRMPMRPCTAREQGVSTRLAKVCPLRWPDTLRLWAVVVVVVVVLIVVVVSLEGWVGARPHPKQYAHGALKLAHAKLDLIAEYSASQLYQRVAHLERQQVGDRG